MSLSKIRSAERKIPRLQIVITDLMKIPHIYLDVN